ncbi:hypothetical protein AAG906_024136 [Vitis piasezkii]
MDAKSVEKTPGILIVGSSSVGKRTLLSRLLSVDFEDGADSSSEILVHGWTINTKYYTADVSVWMAHLHEGFSIGNLPMLDQLAALVMVFDMNDLSSFVALQDWVSHTDIQNFDILLCVGNKVDLVPGHSAHVEYRRRLQRLGDLSAEPYSEFSEYGISETEGSSLLGDEESPWEISRSCLEWCSERNIEYIESCASNADFDKCLSVNGDSQGVDRILGALSAHMWPGMTLKSGDKIMEPSLPENQELSEEESDYEIEYEILSAGSAEPWDDTDEAWVSASGPTASTSTSRSLTQNVEIEEHDQEKKNRGDARELQVSTSTAPSQEEINGEMVPKVNETDEAVEVDEGKHLKYEDLEQLMSEIGNMRDSLRLMPDFQRREMAANLAMKMATMFGDGSDEEGFDG